MMVSELIEQLQKLPQDLDIAIVDMTEVEQYASDEPFSEGIYSEFKIEKLDKTDGLNKPLVAIIYKSDKDHE